MTCRPSSLSSLCRFAHRTWPQARFYTQPANPRAIPRIHAPPLEDFRLNLLSSDQPYLLTGALDTWPALNKWKDLSALRRPEAEGLTVPIEVARLAPGERVAKGYNTKECEHIEMPFGVFMDAFMLKEQPENDTQTRFVGYLAQYTLLDSVWPWSLNSFPLQLM
jgi:hypothetical protein